MGSTASTVFTLVKPLIIEIVQDILKSGLISKGADEAKQAVVESIKEFAGNTDITWDDELAEKVTDHILENNSTDGLANKLLLLLEQWVGNSETKWDDTLIQPVIDHIKQASA